MASFGSTLKSLREKAGLTQAALAELARIGRVQIARLETDESVPTWPTVRRLADALGVSCEEFPASSEREKKPKLGRPPKSKPAADQAEPKKSGRKRGKA